MSFRRVGASLEKVMSQEIERRRKGEQRVAILSRSVEEVAAAVTVPVMGHFYRSAALNVGPGEQTLAWDAEVYDTDDMGPASTLVVAKAGMYVVTSSLDIDTDAANQRLVLQAKRNGTLVAIDRRHSESATASTTVALVTPPLSCEPTDTLEVTITTSAGAGLALVTGSDRAWVSVVRISQEV